MSVLLLVTALGLLAAPGLLRRVGRRLMPSEWARLSAIALTAGAIALEFSLTLLAAPTVLRALGAPALASACNRMFGQLAPGGAYLGWLAAVFAVVLPFLVVRAVRRSHRRHREMWIEPWLGAHLATSDGELVVLPSARLIAYGVVTEGGGQVVVSEGLLDTLDPAERDAVLSHELAHLRWGHQRYLTLATALEGAIPIARFSTVALRTALERWADEDAAGVDTRQRNQVRNALIAMAQAALAPVTELAAFGSPTTIIERVDALERPPVTGAAGPRLLAYAAVGVLGVAGAGTVALWTSQVHMMLAMAGYCVS